MSLMWASVGGGMFEDGSWGGARVVTSFEDGRRQIGYRTFINSGRKRKIPLNITDKYAKMESPKDSDEFDSEELDDTLENSVEIDEDLQIQLSDGRHHQWQLYKAITSITLNNGNNLCAPFLKLPSKK